MDKIERGVGRDIFFDIFKYLLWILSINFFGGSKLQTNFENEIELDLTIFLSSKFFVKSYSTMPKWGLKFYIEYNFYILTMTGQALIFKLPHTLKIYDGKWISL